MNAVLKQKLLNTNEPVLVALAAEENVDILVMVSSIMHISEVSLAGMPRTQIFVQCLEDLRMLLQHGTTAQVTSGHMNINARFEGNFIHNKADLNGRINKLNSDFFNVKVKNWKSITKPKGIPSSGQTKVFGDDIGYDDIDPFITILIWKDVN